MATLSNSEEAVEGLGQQVQTQIDEHGSVREKYPVLKRTCAEKVRLTRLL